MIRIYTNSKFAKEKSYTCKVLFTEILEQSFEIIIEDRTDYKIEFPNKSIVICNDAFFSSIPQDNDYKHTKYLPTKCLWKTIDNTNIPIIYGDASITITETETSCGIDIIASSFFMLSRWEEFICKETDSYMRFPEEKSFAVKHSCINIPIVHIYASCIQFFSKQMGFEITIARQYKKTMTHDIDSLKKWHTPLDVLKTCLGDIFKRKSFAMACNTWHLFSKKEDPYNTFDGLMDSKISHTWYFLCTKRNLRVANSTWGKQIMQTILASGADIQIHAQVFLEKDISKLQKDIQALKTICTTNATKCRQHFLQFRIPQTLRLLEACNIAQDSSLYYRNYPGFRTGMCIEHSLFDCEQRKELQIKELPLILMDVSLDILSYSEAKDVFNNLEQQIKKYQGNFVMLWHNSTFDDNKSKNIRLFYEEICM